MALLAYRQHGVVARRQLLALGLTRTQIEGRLARGHLHRVHAGVYAVGHRRLTRYGRWMAAVLANGEQAVLSHRSAAALWGIGEIEVARIEITVPHRPGNGRGRPGITNHRTRNLPDEDRSVRFAIPVTAPSRTLIDLAAVVGSATLRKAVHAADRLELLDVDGLGRFLRICDDASLPRPAVNVLIEGFEVDCLWSGPRLVVELDSYGFHRDPDAFETDRKRDVTLQLAGYRVLRFTHRRVVERPETVLAELRAALGEIERP